MGVLYPKPVPSSLSFAFFSSPPITPATLSSAWLTTPQSLGIQPSLGRCWSSSRPPCTQQPVLSIWTSYVQGTFSPLFPWYCELDEKHCSCLDGPRHFVRRERCCGDLIGSLELPAKINSHLPPHIGGKEPWCFSWPSPSLTKWIWCSTGMASSSLCALGQHSGPLFKHLVMAPYVVPLG